MTGHVSIDSDSVDFRAIRMTSLFALFEQRLSFEKTMQTHTGLLGYLVQDTKSTEPQPGCKAIEMFLSCPRGRSLLIFWSLSIILSTASMKLKAHLSNMLSVMSGSSIGAGIAAAASARAGAAGPPGPPAGGSTLPAGSRRPCAIPSAASAAISGGCKTVSCRGRRDIHPRSRADDEHISVHKAQQHISPSQHKPSNHPTPLVIFRCS